MGTESAAAIRFAFARLGLSHSRPPSPAGAYRAVVTRGNQGFVSGQFPIDDGTLQFRGRLGDVLDVQAGRAAARLAAANVLAQINAHLGDWSRFGGLLRVDGFVASAPGFLRQPEILDAASTLFVEVLGPELGAHTRTAFSVEQLPLGSSIELCVTFCVKTPRD